MEARTVETRKRRCAGSSPNLLASHSMRPRWHASPILDKQIGRRIASSRSSAVHDPRDFNAGRIRRRGDRAWVCAGRLLDISRVLIPLAQACSAPKAARRDVKAEFKPALTRPARSSPLVARCSRAGERGCRLVRGRGRRARDAGEARGADCAIMARAASWRSTGTGEAGVEKAFDERPRALTGFALGIFAPDGVVTCGRGHRPHAPPVRSTLGPGAGITYVHA